VLCRGRSRNFEGEGRGRAKQKYDPKILKSDLLKILKSRPLKNGKKNL